MGDSGRRPSDTVSRRSRLGGFGAAGWLRGERLADAGAVNREPRRGMCAVGIFAKRPTRGCASFPAPEAPDRGDPLGPRGPRGLPVRRAKPPEREDREVHRLDQPRESVPADRPRLRVPRGRPHRREDREIHLECAGARELPRVVARGREPESGPGGAFGEAREDPPREGARRGRRRRRAVSGSPFRNSLAPCRSASRAARRASGRSAARGIDLARSWTSRTPASSRSRSAASKPAPGSGVMR